MENLEENLEIENTCQRLRPEEVRRIAHISQRLVNDPREFFSYPDHIFARVESQNTLFYHVLSQMLIPAISPEIISTIITIIMAIS